MGNTKAEILTRLLAEVRPQLDKTEGSFPHDILSANAIEFETLHKTVADGLKEQFISTMTNFDRLKQKGAEYYVFPLEATASTTPLTFAGTLGTVVPVDTLVQTPGGISFLTTEELVLPGATGTVVAEAEIAGTSGNVAAGACTILVLPIDGITGVTNAAPSVGGTDAETIEPFRTRVLDKLRVNATSGNPAHYKQWAKEVDGIGEAKIFPLWAGNGTVKVLVVDVNREAASAPLIAAVAAHIEEERPIGPTVTVDAPTTLDIDIMANVDLLPGYTLGEVTAIISEAVETYLDSLVFVKDTVSYAQIGGIILGCEGVADYSGLTVNGGVANIAIGSTEIAVKGTLTIS